MSASESGKNKPVRREGPQGTRVFSQDEIDSLLAEAVSDNSAASQVRLRGVSESVAGQSHPLKRDRVVIGRDQRCDLVIDEPSISSEHCRISRDAGGGWEIANLLSTNGTFVNDTKIHVSPLRHGDRVRLGRSEWLFEDPTGESESGEEPGGDELLKLLPWIIGAVAAAGLLYWLFVR